MATLYVSEFAAIAPGGSGGAAHEAYLKAKADLHEFQPAPRAG